MDERDGMHAMDEVDEVGQRLFSSFVARGAARRIK